MGEGLRREIQRLILLGAGGVIIGLAVGYVAETLIAVGLAYTFHTLARIRKLYHWLASDSTDLPPEMSGVWADISDQLYRYKQKLEGARRNHAALALRIRQITAALDDGMLLLNRDRTLDWWNPSASQLLRLRDTDQGEAISNLVRNPVFVNFIHGDDFEQPLEMHAPQDSTRIYQFSAGHFGRGEIVLMVRDITRLRHLEEMRKEFVANISHELRTPLTVLVGYIETLQANPESLPGHWHRALEQMDQQTRRLSALAEDLVMLSRLESTPPRGRGHPVELAPLLQTICETARVVSEGHHRITLDCEPDLRLDGESRELHSAFSNLVINAVKHNPEGCDIHVAALRAGSEVLVTISDDGVGIDSRHLPRLTERFYRADESRATSSGGTGLGLAIVKHVLNRHGGHLDVESTPGRGTTFTCRFEGAAVA